VRDDAVTRINHARKRKHPVLQTQTALAFTTLCSKLDRIVKMLLLYGDHVFT